MPSPDPAPRIEQLALLVARGQSVAGASREMEVNERTARRWTTTPEYKAALKFAREEIIAQTVNALASLGIRAVLRLGKLMDSSDEDVVLKASVALLDRMISIREHAEMGERLEAIEARLADVPTTKGWG